MNSIIERIRLFQEYYDKENEDQAILIAVGTPYIIAGQDGYIRHQWMNVNYLLIK
jgi:hypothetical protein